MKPVYVAYAVHVNFQHISLLDIDTEKGSWRPVLSGPRWFWLTGWSCCWGRSVGVSLSRFPDRRALHVCPSSPLLGFKAIFKPSFNFSYSWTNNWTLNPVLFWTAMTLNQSYSVWIRFTLWHDKSEAYVCWTDTENKLTVLWLMEQCCHSVMTTPCYTAMCIFLQHWRSYYTTDTPCLLCK